MNSILKRGNSQYAQFIVILLIAIYIISLVPLVAAEEATNEKETNDFTKLNTQYQKSWEEANKKVTDLEKNIATNKAQTVALKSLRTNPDTLSSDAINLINQLVGVKAVLNQYNIATQQAKPALKTALQVVANAKIKELEEGITNLEAQLKQAKTDEKAKKVVLNNHLKDTIDKNFNKAFKGLIGILIIASILAFIVRNILLDLLKSTSIFKNLESIIDAIKLGDKPLDLGMVVWAGVATFLYKVTQGSSSILSDIETFVRVDIIYNIVMWLFNTFGTENLDPTKSINVYLVVIAAIFILLIGLAVVWKLMLSFIGMIKKTKENKNIEDKAEGLGQALNVGQAVRKSI